jgi:phosphohistidine phosphatase
MMRELFILRHGKADRPEGLADVDRPLKKRGRQDAKHIGRWLHERELSPDYVLSSPASRALQTAQHVCKQLDIDPDTIVCDAVIYEADPSSLVAVLRKCPETARRVLLVGHNPGLEGLILALTGYSEPLPDDASHLSTAAMAQLVFEGQWADLVDGCAKWVMLVRPDSLS